MSFEFLSRIGLLLIFIITLTLIWTGATVAAHLLTHIKIDKISIFYGKPVFTFNCRSFPIHIGYIPTGAYVAHNLEDFPKHSFSARAIVILAGPIALLISAIVCLGFHEAGSQTISAFSQLARGVSEPLSSGRPLIAQFFRTAQASPVIGCGIFISKLLPLYLIPAPVMPAGQLLIETQAKRGESALAKVAKIVGVIIALPVYVCWTIAVVSYFWQSL